MTTKKRSLDEEELYERREAISDMVHALVNEMTADLTKEDDWDVRQTLTEQFRFWRR